MSQATYMSRPLRKETSKMLCNSHYLFIKCVDLTTICGRKVSLNEPNYILTGRKGILYVA